MKKLILSLVIKILNLNLSITKYIRKEIAKDKPPVIQKRKKRNPKEVSPVKHRKAMPQNISCPDCKATAHYIYLNGKVYSKLQKKTVQRYKCKRCDRQWINPPREYQKTSFSLSCPFCGKRLDFKKRRKSFEVFKCINPFCPHRQKYNKRYAVRMPKINIAEVEEKLPFYKTKFHPQIVVIAIALYSSFTLSSREVAKLLFSLYNIKISHQTILNLYYSLASLLKEKDFPIQYSNLWVIDEKYVRYNGKWGYLISILDSNGNLISNYFSPTRSVLGAYKAFYLACSKAKPDIIVSDNFSIYPLTIQIISAEFNVKPEHIKIKGLCAKNDTPKEREHRKYKNLIENYHSQVEPFISKKRGFGSYKGAVAFFTLFRVWYNQVKSEPNILLAWSNLTSQI